MAYCKNLIRNFNPDQLAQKLSQVLDTQENTVCFFVCLFVSYKMDSYSPGQFKNHSNCYCFQNVLSLSCITNKNKKEGGQDNFFVIRICGIIH